jgi:hypothetical protein
MKILDTDLPKGRAHLWSVMAELSLDGGSFTLRDLVGRQNGVSRQAVKNWLQFCLSEGAAEVVERGTLPNGFPIARYRIVPGRKSPPVQRLDGSTHGDRQQQLWNALRATRGFIATRDLAFAASTDTVQVTQSLAAKYCAALAASGYLVRLADARGVASYRLRPDMNSGPRAPAALKTDGVYDFNLRRAVNVTGSDQGAAA